MNSTATPLRASPNAPMNDPTSPRPVRSPSPYLPPIPGRPPTYVTSGLGDNWSAHFKYCVAGAAAVVRVIAFLGRRRRRTPRSAWAVPGLSELAWHRRAIRKYAHGVRRQSLGRGELLRAPHALWMGLPPTRARGSCHEEDDLDAAAVDRGDAGGLPPFAERCYRLSGVRVGRLSHAVSHRAFNVVTSYFTAALSGPFVNLSSPVRQARAWHARIRHGSTRPPSSSCLLRRRSLPVL